MAAFPTKSASKAVDGEAVVWNYVIGLQFVRQSNKSMSSSVEFYIFKKGFRSANPEDYSELVSRH